jgi:hypothetical protein
MLSLRTWILLKLALCRKLLALMRPPPPLPLLPPTGNPSSDSWLLLRLDCIRITCWPDAAAAAANGSMDSCPELPNMLTAEAAAAAVAAGRGEPPGLTHLSQTDTDSTCRQSRFSPLSATPACGY